MNQWGFLSCGDGVFSEGHDTKSHAFFCPGLTSFFKVWSPVSGEVGSGWNLLQHQQTNNN